MKNLLAFITVVSSFITSQQAFSLDILPRSGWGAKSGISSRMDTHTLREIVVHHTGVRKQSKYSLKQKLKFLQEYSQRDKNWGDVPYHFYIDMNGDVGEGRELRFSGDTNTSYNPANRIHIVVEGDLENERPSNRQIQSLRELVSMQQSVHGLNPDAVSGHMDHASTDCPGQYLYPVIASLRGGDGTYCSGAEFEGECFSRSEVYMTAQSFLQSYNCYSSGLDGQWGSGSRGALQSFNQINGTNLSISSSNAMANLLSQFSTRSFRSCTN